jgi:hypothetical protein
MKKLLWSLVSATLLFAPTSSKAGVQSPGHPTCKGNDDGSGACFGTFASFRNSTDATARAVFELNAAATESVVYYQFNATLSGVDYACTANAPTLAAAWPMAMAARGYFFVKWDSQGNCTHLELQNDTAFSPF